MNVRTICETAAAPTFARTPAGKSRKVDFNLSAVTADLLNDESFLEAAPTVALLRQKFKDSAFNYIMRSLVRQALFIQLVKVDITTTWYEVRWATGLESNDPRRADADTCMEILEKGAAFVLAASCEPTGARVIEGLVARGRLMDGLPIDYVDQGATPIHAASNLRWLDERLTFDLVKQRLFLTDKARNPEHAVFKEAYEKIRVKTYLTDRVMTGPHKTNREYRWETRPESVHFALRGACMEIERELIDQLCRLQGIPETLRDLLMAEDLVDSSKPVQLCPVTLDPLRWEDFRAEMSAADHGRSLFQVGHLNPLKADHGNDPNWGHSAKNVSWISQDGNRIQGHHSLVETRALLSRIAANYAAADRHTLEGDAQQLSV